MEDFNNEMCFVFFDPCASFCLSGTYELIWNCLKVKALVFFEIKLCYQQNLLKHICITQVYVKQIRQWEKLHVAFIIHLNIFNLLVIEVEELVNFQLQLQYKQLSKKEYKIILYCQKN